MQVAYIAADIHIECGLGIGPDHAIGCKVRLHTRWLEREEDGTIRRRGREVGPCYRRCVAHYLRALDEVFERICGLEGWDRREAIRRDQVDMGELFHQFLRLSGQSGVDLPGGLVPARSGRAYCRPDSCRT